MIDILAPLSPEYSLEIPERPGVILVWLLWFVILVFLGVRSSKRKFQFNRSNLIWFAILSLSILLFTPFIGIAIGEDNGGQPFNHLIFLAAVPWMLAGGVLGILPGAILAGVSGLLLSYLDTHNIFTPVIFMSISMFYGWSISQSYRTVLFKLLRSPLIAAIFSSITVFPLVLFSILITIDGSLAHRLTLAFDIIPSNFFAVSGMIIIGGVICAVFRRLFRKAWLEGSDLEPPPFETSMISRWLAVILPLLIAVWAISTYSTWVVAENKAHEMIVSELTETAGQISDELSVIKEMGDGRLTEVDLTDNLLGVQLMQFMESFAENRKNIELISGDGILLFPGSGSVQYYQGRSFTTPTYFEETGFDGSKTINYFQPIPEIQWAVVVSAQQTVISDMAWETAAPVFLFGLGMILIIILGLIIIWSQVKKSISQWSLALEKIHDGDMDTPLPSKNLSGELSRLSVGVNQLVNSFREKLENQFDLTAVSKETTGRLDLEGSLDVVMKAALVHNVSAVRIILTGEQLGGFHEGSPQRFGMGKHARLLASLDEQVLTCVQEKGEYISRNFQAGRTFSLEKGMPYPASLMAFPIASGENHFGVFWVSYQDLQSPNDEDVSYFKALAKKASMIVSNNHKFNQTMMLRGRFEKVIEAMPDAVFLTDSNSHIIYQNQLSSKVLKQLELGGGKGSDGSSISHIHLVNLINENSNAPVSFVVNLDDGKMYKVFATSIDIGGQQRGHMVVMRDVTQEKEENLKKSEYVTTVSHELRSPLTLIQGYAKILRLTGNLNEQQGNYIDNIIEGAEEMKSLVHNLLNIGRLEGGEPLEFKQVFAGDLLQKVADSMSAQAKQKNILLNVEYPKQQTIVEGDTTYLTQAIKNLVDNSIKFTKMGGEVVLSTLDDGYNVTFSVRDNGAGISPLDQRHVFDKFHRSSSSPDGKQKGSGLGLAIVKSIAEHHGGKVWFESQLGQGSIFYMQIPKISSRK